MSEPIIGEIRMMGFNFAPRGWALCDGQLLPISTNTSLFSLLGTTYGGDGRTTFALPDLRGRVPMHPGAGPGLTTRSLGEAGGTETETLTAAQMPSHTHSVNCLNAPGDNRNPAGRILAGEPDEDFQFTNQPPDSTMDAGMIAETGDGEAHPNLQPFRCVNFCIALVGLFPSRS